jgi:hypothetical protein
MSWSVNARGKIADVKVELDRQFQNPLAKAPAGFDDGERETVRRVSETIAQCLETFDPERPVWVHAHGHMGFDNLDTRAGAYQEVSVSIKPDIRGVSGYVPR